MSLPDQEAEGWYEDPYGLHEHRWFSAGKATRLVRDGEVEAYDPLPDRPFQGPLVHASSTPSSGANGSDLQRAGGTQSASNRPTGESWDAAIGENNWGYP